MDIKLIPVHSTSVMAIGYDAESRTIRVQFRSGKSYDYPEQSPEDFAALRDSQSKGRAVSRLSAGARPAQVAPTAQFPPSNEGAKSEVLESLTEEAEPCCRRAWNALPNRSKMTEWTCPTCGLDFVVELVGAVRSWTVRTWSARI